MTAIEATIKPHYNDGVIPYRIGTEITCPVHGTWVYPHPPGDGPGVAGFIAEHHACTPPAPAAPRKTYRPKNWRRR